MLRFENRFIDKVETFFAYNIAFKRNIKQNELDIKGFFRYNEFNVILFRH